MIRVSATAFCRLRLFADQGSGAASVLSTQNPGFFLLDNETSLFFAALLSSTILYIPRLGFKELNYLAAVQRSKSLDLSSTMA